MPLPKPSRAARPTRSRRAKCSTPWPCSKRSLHLPRGASRSASPATRSKKGNPMPITVLFPEARQQPDAMEQGVFGADVRIVKRDASALSEISDADCAEADGLMIMGFGVTGADLARFPKLRCIVRMGVGYDKLDRPSAASRNILVCNVPDYGTPEVADHAIALALTLRRGILLHQIGRA